MVVYAFNPSTEETRGRQISWVLSQPSLQSELQNSQGYTEKPSLQKPKLQPPPPPEPKAKQKTFKMKESDNSELSEM